MRLKRLIIIVALGVFFIPSVSFGQKSDSTKMKMNRISLQTGLFHYFFDKSPILNLNHREFAGKPRSGLFHQLFISSLGVQYERKINTKNTLSFEFISFRNVYWKHGDTYPIEDALVHERFFSTFNINYSRNISFLKKFDFIYGGGLNYRHGRETIIITRHPIAYWQGEWVYELIVDGSLKNDFGLNTFVGIDYSPLKWLSLYTRVDFMSLVYINDKEAVKRFEENYNNVPSHFPSRFDLSFRLGIGVNF